MKNSVDEDVLSNDWPQSFRQRRCYPQEAVVESVELQGSGYVDVPGVVWQSLREESSG